MKDKKFLVTGGAGFIGSHLVESLLGLGAEVRVLDNLSQGQRQWVPLEAEWVEGDITDLSTCKKCCQDVSGVFHLAAMSRVAPSIDRFEFCVQQNVIGTQNILLASRDAHVSKVVYSGSSSYYGKHAGMQSEDLLPDCLNPYALSKYVGEQFCEQFTRIYGLSTLSLRFFNVYGPRQPRTGNYALVIGTFLDRLLHAKPLEIHGDGSQRRDFIHVRDVVEAMIAAFCEPAQGMVLNVGTGKNHSIQELADLISKYQVYVSRRAGDALETLADIERSKKFLNWSAKISLKEGLSELKAISEASELPSK